MRYRWKRRHLIEIHEQEWCPAAIRDGATDYLRFLTSVTQQYRHVIIPLRQAVIASRSERIIDLCSGGGGPWPGLHQALDAAMPIRIPVLLTDLHPNKGAAKTPLQPGPQIVFWPTPIDATRMPSELTGFRTLFTAFHHFTPQDAASILQDAIDHGQGIGIFEQTARTRLAVAMMLVLPWLALLAAPFVRPFRFDRLFFTWIVPLIPLVLCIDGIVSCMRTYSPAELRELTGELNPSRAGLQYRWDIGHLPSPLSPVGVTYAVGYPVRPKEE